MSLTPLVGHQLVRSRLSEAVVAGRLPQVILLTGPRGVGKQRLALWLAARLLCERQRDEPCGECTTCRRVGDLVHPDVHWLVPVLRPKASEADKQVEEVAAALEEVMAERRASGQWSAPDGMAIHGIASARWLIRRASMKSAEGGWRVFVIGRAERLVPQESSQEAANALLKLLEEPPARSVFVLTTAEPGMVLPTIRSRAVPLRLGRLADGEVAAVARALGVEATPPMLADAAGAPGRLMASTDDTRAKALARAQQVLRAVGTGAADAATVSLRQPLAGARGEFTAMLDAMVELLEGELRQQAAAIGKGRRTMQAIELVLATREQAQGNVNPQLALAALLDELALVEAACA